MTTRKPRSDSYAAQIQALAPEAWRAFEPLLTDPSLSLAQLQSLAPPWQRGKFKGRRPSLELLSNLATRYRTEAMLLNVQATAKMMEAVKHKVRRQAPDQAEALLDLICDSIGEEVLRKTLEGVDAKGRTAAARLLLKRADQRRFDRRMRLLESKVERATRVTADRKLSPAEKEARFRQIFGIS